MVKFTPSSPCKTVNLPDLSSAALTILVGQPLTVTQLVDRISRVIYKDKVSKVLYRLVVKLEEKGLITKKKLGKYAYLYITLKGLIWLAKVDLVDHEKLYEFETANLSKLKISGIFRELIELLYRLIIRIRDLLHLAYVYMLSKTHGIEYFLTRD